MHDIFKVARWEISRNIKNKTFIFLTIIFPLIILAISGISGYVASRSGDGQNLQLGVINKVGFLTTTLETRFRENDYQVRFYNQTEEEQIDELLGEEKLDGILVIPEDVLENNEVNYYFKELYGLETGFIKETLSPLLIEKRLETRGYPPEEIIPLTNMVRITTHSLSKSRDVVSMFVPFGLAMLMVFGSFMVGAMLMQGIIKEKNNRIVELILSSISARSLMSGKVLGYGILGLFQIVIWLATALFVLSYLHPTALNSLLDIKNIYMFIYFIFGFIIISSLNAIIGASMKDAQAGNQSGGIFMLLPIVPVYFSGAIINNPQGTISRVLSYIPFFTPTTMMIRLGFSSPEPIKIIGTLILLFVSTCLLVLLSSKIFRVGMLMYGKSANLKEIIRWVRSKSY